MRILLVSMPSLHFFRWTEQLIDSDHELFWFDITGSGTLAERIGKVEQLSKWKRRVNYPGRYFLKRRFPALHELLEKFNSRDVNIEFMKQVERIKPDVVHSFAIYVSCAPILKTMNAISDLPWIFSSWGSDLFYFQTQSKYLQDIRQVLARANYMFSDCKRDLQLARKYGFEGSFLGVFPGGGGFHFNVMEPFMKPIQDRNVILVKGFQGRSGRAIQVLKALFVVSDSLHNFKIIVFGAGKEVKEFLSNQKREQGPTVMVHGRLSHIEVLKLMGAALIYIGNSNSDGIPNTLLEALCMGAFPIQSNPGGVSEEIIENEKNGLLIEDCEDIEGIAAVIKAALEDTAMLQNAISHNLERVKPDLEYSRIRDQVLHKYREIESNKQIIS